MSARVVLHVVCQWGLDVLNPPSPFEAYLVCALPMSINEGRSPPVNETNSLYAFPGANLLCPFSMGHQFTPPPVESIYRIYSAVVFNVDAPCFKTFVVPMYDDTSYCDTNARFETMRQYCFAFPSRSMSKAMDLGVDRCAKETPYFVKQCAHSLQLGPLGTRGLR